MSEIRVESGSLTSSGSQLAAAGSAVRGLAGAVRAASGAAGATGYPVAAEAYARMCQVWSAELDGLGAHTIVVGRATTWAADLYRAVDESVMPVLGW